MPMIPNQKLPNPRPPSALITGINGNVGKACKQWLSAHEWSVLGDIYGRDKGKINLVDWKEVNKSLSHASMFDLVVMAHGVQIPANLTMLDADNWQQVIDNNLTASAVLTSALLRYSCLAPGGLIIFFSSIQATQPRAGRGAYAAAKAGVEDLMRATAVEVGSFSARAVAIRAGQMTEAMENIKFSQDQLDYIGKKMPLGLVDPLAIAQLIDNLYHMPYITGEVIEVSAGHNLNIW